MPLEQQIVFRNRLMQANNGQVNMLSGDYEQRLPILLKRVYKKYGGEKSYEEINMLILQMGSIQIATI